MVKNHGEVYSIQHYLIKFVSDLRQVGGFRWVSSTNKTDHHGAFEILLKVALSTIILKDSISKLSVLSSNQSKTNSLSFPRS
jgi:hypothetical protein